MPILKKCTMAGCREIVRDGKHRCLKHRSIKNKPNDETLERHSFYNTTRWKKFSRLMRQERPVCEICQRALSEHLDHWIEISIDSQYEYAFDPRNMVGMCRSCHISKTQKLKRFIKNEDYQRIYQWCYEHHPRKADRHYINDWRLSKNQKTKEA